MRLLQLDALHRARWMAKVIDGIKIWLLTVQFSFTGREKTWLQKFRNSVIPLYVPTWFADRNATEAAAHELDSTHPWWSVPVWTKGYQRHLWCLSKQLVVLARWCKLSRLWELMERNPPKKLRWIWRHLQPLSYRALPTHRAFSRWSARKWSRILRCPAAGVQRNILDSFSCKRELELSKAWPWCSLSSFS